MHVPAGEGRWVYHVETLLALIKAHFRNTSVDRFVRHFF